MFIGEYIHSIDDKKRLSVPARFRKELGKQAILARGIDRCLALYPMKEWKDFTLSLGKLSKGKAEDREFARFMLAGAVEVEVDAIGRILVPDHLKLHAGIKEKVVFAGLATHVELWSEAAWNEERTQMVANAGRIAERLGESGMF